MTLYVLNYNNYYNRIVKKYSTVQEYLDNVEVIYTLEDTNFNPNDNVNTTHTFGWSLATDNYEGNGNYLLVVDEEENIVSRWFILDSVRDTGGQWTCSLHRDVIADHYEAVVNAPCFIEKAHLSLSDTMIYNSENMTYNQVKTNEYELKDSSNTAWIVGYINRSLTTNKSVEYIYQPNFDYSVAEFDDFDGAQYREFNSTVGTATDKKFEVVYFGEGAKFKAAYDLTGNRISYTEPYKGDLDTTLTAGSSSTISFLDTATKEYMESYEGKRMFLREFGEDDLQKLYQYNGKILKVGTDDLSFFKMILRKKEPEVQTTAIKEQSFGTHYINKLITKGILNSSQQPFNRKGIYKTQTKTIYYLAFQNITNTIKSYNITIPAERRQLSDAPYDMFAMPVSNLTLGLENLTMEIDVAFGVASKIYKELGGGGEASNIFDIQYLPYCPLENINELMESGLSSLSQGLDYSYITSGNANESILFFLKKSSFTTTIPLTIDTPDTDIEFKVANECDMYRLCAPNYSGAFQFSLTKNNGLKYFEVNATYKPYNPYIHLNPNWGGLYGQDFNDARGLILGGDFSIAALSSAWENYQLQNKNFEQIFKREIQSMELKNSLGAEQDVWNAISGTISGGVSGASTAAMASGGNPYAAIGGAVVGAGVSLAGGIRDIDINRQLRNDALDYTKDMYGYNLGNIQAIPNTLSKTSAFDINNKIFPFLEYYTATPAEKEALRNKIKYNGMTVMRIDYINSFIREEETYIKGKLIRLEDIDEDYHILNTIGSEVNLGFFIKKEDTE